MKRERLLLLRQPISVGLCAASAVIQNMSKFSPMCDQVEAADNKISFHSASHQWNFSTVFGSNKFTSLH